MVLDEENVKEQENQAEEGQKESNNDDCFRFNGDSICTLRILMSSTKRTERRRD